MSKDKRWSQIGSLGSMDRLARSNVSIDLPEARTCRESREQSRKEMHVLNEKLASHLEKMRYLSEQNKKLLHESSSPKETEAIRQMYVTELKQLRQLVDECEHEKADSLAKMASLQDAVRTKQDEIKHLGQTNQRLSHQLDQAMKEASMKDADKNLLERHFKSAEEEIGRLQKTVDQLKQANAQLHKNLDDETANRMHSQSEMQTLREEMEFQRRVHEQEIEDLRNAFNENLNPQNGTDGWREEMQNAIRDIKQDYDKRLDRIRDEMDQNYSLRIEEISKMEASQKAALHRLKDENDKLRNNMEMIQKREEQLRARCEQCEASLDSAKEEVRKLRHQLSKTIEEFDRERQSAEEALTLAHRELSALTDAKLNLEAEIAAYGRLLDAQESLISSSKRDSKHSRSKYSASSNRTKSDINSTSPVYISDQRNGYGTKYQNVDNVKRWIEREEPSGQSVRPQVHERTVEGCHQLSCSYSEIDKLNETCMRGQLAINDCAQNGSYIEITNKGNVDESLSGWSIIRNIDGGRQIIRYTFPNHTLAPHCNMKLWAGNKPNRSTCLRDIETPYSTWGTGTYIQTTLYSPDGLEKASHIQRLQFNP